MIDERIKIQNVFKKETQYGKIYNISVSFQIDEVMVIYFQIKRLPKLNGMGNYYQWPVNVYDKDLYKESGYKRGVEKFLFGNKEFGLAVQNAAELHITGQPLASATPKEEVKQEPLLSDTFTATFKGFEQLEEKDDTKIDDIEF